MTGSYAQTIATVQPQLIGGQRNVVAEGVVEAVRQSTLSAQVAGAVLELRVKPGDRVRAGQLLVRLDPRAADQSTRASQAQVEVARTARDIAQRELTRQRALFQKGFISQAALDQAEAAFRAAEAQWSASTAQAAAVGAQGEFHLIRAPYDGVVAEVPVVVGDMALPGRPLLSVYDPAAMRVTAVLSQSNAAPLLSQPLAVNRARIDIGGFPAMTPQKISVIPAADPSTHTVQLRLDLADNRAASLVPGMFARVAIDIPQSATTRATQPSSASVSIPATALLRRGDMYGVYVVDQDNRPRLRQVRIGMTRGADIEILSGLDGSERIAVDAQSAAKVR
jgi:RND family efflux transporter MFP subunit